MQAYDTSASLGLYSTEVIYDVPAAATITSLSPTSGPIATAVTIAGTNFGATKGTSTVTFNGTTATPTSWSATTGNVVVTVGGLASNGVSFTVTVPPTITTLSPTIGPIVTASVLVTVVFPITPFSVSL